MIGAKAVRTAWLEFSQGHLNKYQSEAFLDVAGTGPAVPVADVLVPSGGMPGLPPR